MTKVLATIGVLACLALALPGAAQSVADAFKDLPATHWAYPSADNLRAKGVITGYPEPYFKGKRALTRYEFALALDRALARVTPRGDHATGSDSGAAGSLTESGDPSPLTVTTSEVDALRRLASEFQNELAIVGTSPALARAKLDRLQRDAEARKRTARAGSAPAPGPTPKLPDGALDRSSTRGAGQIPAGPSREANSHLPSLGSAARAPGRISLKIGQLDSTSILGTGYDTLRPSTPSRDALDIRPTVATAGPVTTMSVERLRYSLSRLTMVAAHEDRAFADPGDDGSPFGLDGMRMAAHVGSVVVEAFAGQAYSVSGTLGMKTDGSLIESASDSAQTRSTVPTIALGSSNASNQFGVRQLGGVSLRIPMAVFSGGHIRLTSIGSTGAGSSDAPDTSVFGAETELRVTRRLTLSGEWARTGASQTRLPTLDGQNSAYSGSVGYRNGPLRFSAEYKYVDPLFYAPGYWGRIGGWLNPTNIQGPGFRAAYEGGGFGVTFGGDFYSGARSRDDLGGLGTNDDMTRVLVGVRWDVSRNLRANLDWEGVYWRLNSQIANLPSLAGNATPREQYVTISTGYNLSSSTLLRLGYQRGGLISGGGGLSGATSISTFTGQMAIKF